MLEHLAQNVSDEEKSFLRFLPGITVVNLGLENIEPAERKNYVCKNWVL